MQSATVGLAFGQNSDITAEAADAVIMEPSLGKIDEIMHIGRRMRVIALQSAIGGMALSCIGMGLAVAGYLPPIAGAVAQEAIDVLAVLNALRVGFPLRALDGLLATRSELEDRVHHRGVGFERAREAELLAHAQHRAVVGQDMPDDAPDALGATDLDEPAQQLSAETVVLEPVGHHERELRLVPLVRFDQPAHRDDRGAGPLPPAVRPAPSLDRSR